MRNLHRRLLVRILEFIPLLSPPFLSANPTRISGILTERWSNALFSSRDVLRPGFDTMSMLVHSNEGGIPTRIKRQSEGEKMSRKTNQSSEAIPRSLQHRMRAFDLHPSVAVGNPAGSKKVCSPLATETNLFHAINMRNERRQERGDVPTTGDETPFS